MFNFKFLKIYSPLGSRIHKIFWKIWKILKKKSFGFGKKNFCSDTDTDTRSFGQNSAPIPNFGRTLLTTHPYLQLNLDLAWSPVFLLKYCLLMTLLPNFLGNVHKWCPILGWEGGSSKMGQNRTRGVRYESKNRTSDFSGIFAPFFCGLIS